MDMEKPKRSYYLPGKHAKAFNAEFAKSGYVKEKVAAVAMYDFLNSDPNTRSEMFDRLDKFVNSKSKSRK